MSILAARFKTPLLIHDLANGDYKVRRAAITTLKEIGPQAIPGLVKYLSYNHNSSVRQAAVTALEVIGRKWRNSEIVKQAIPALAKALADRNADIRRAAAMTLKEIDSEWQKSEVVKQAIPALVKSLAEGRAVRNAAERVLEEIDPKWRNSEKVKHIIPTFIESLNDQNSEVRREVAAALGIIGPDAGRSIPALTKALADWDWHVRRESALALAAIGRDAGYAIPALTKVLTDANDDVRKAAAEALGMICPDIIPDLVKTLADKKYEVREAAVRSLEAIDLNWRRSEIVKQTIPAIAKFLSDEDRKVREAAVAALRKIGPDAGHAIPALSKALTDANDDVRKAAAKALGTICPDIIPDLVKTLADKKYEVREAAVKALEAIDPNWRRSEIAKQAMPISAKSLADEDRKLRERRLMWLNAKTNWPTCDVKTVDQMMRSNSHLVVTKEGKMLFAYYFESYWGVRNQWCTVDKDKLIDTVKWFLDPNYISRIPWVDARKIKPVCNQKINYGRLSSKPCLVLNCYGMQFACCVKQHPDSVSEWFAMDDFSSLEDSPEYLQTYLAVDKWVDPDSIKPC